MTLSTKSTSSTFPMDKGYGQVVEVIRESAKRYGFTFSDSPTAEDLRRLRFVLPQLWPNFDESVKESLHNMALEISARGMRLSFWQFVKGLPRLAVVMPRMYREAASKSKDIGTFALEMNQELKELMAEVIRLHAQDIVGNQLDLDEQAVVAAVPKLQQFGLRFVEFKRGKDRGLNLQCFVDPAIENEYQPTQQIGVELMKVINDSGGWVNDIEFIPAHA